MMGSKLSSTAYKVQVVHAYKAASGHHKTHSLYGSLKKRERNFPLKKPSSALENPKKFKQLNVVQ